MSLPLCIKLQKKKKMASTKYLKVFHTIIQDTVCSGKVLMNVHDTMHSSSYMGLSINHV